MKKNLGIIVTLFGIVIILVSLISIPAHTLNPVDSTNGLYAAAAEFFGGLIICGAGVVILANDTGKKKHPIR